MPGLFAELYNHCRSTLMRCSKFDSNASLRAVFVTNELYPFRDRLPTATSKGERVDACLDFLLDKRLSDGRPVLPLFLAALRDRYQQGDALHNELGMLAEAAQSAFASSDPLSVVEHPSQNPQPVQQIEDHPLRILHISDIHRAPNAPTSNTTLLGKLLDDIRFTYDEDNAQFGSGEPQLGPPDLIVVSGDLTQCAEEAEFEVALRFLEGLLPLVDDDRQRAVLVPGNHDLNWTIAAQSYTPATKKDYDGQPPPGEPYSQSVKQASDGTYWRRNDATYTDRFKPFKTFFDAFYQGAYTYTLARDQMFTVHDMSESLGLVMVGFNSCDEIDAYLCEGKLSSLDSRAFINTDAIYNTQQSPAFHADQRGLLRIGVFHHNIRPVKHGEDFLDPKYLQILKRHGCDLCLHGHVHTLSHDLFDATQVKTLPVVGAGSLAAPYVDRPAAAPMGYNVVVIGRQSSGIWVHTRRHDENNLVWAADYQWEGKPYFTVRSPMSGAITPTANGTPGTTQSPQKVSPVNVTLSSELRLSLINALLLVPAAAAFQGRTALLGSIASINLNRTPVSARSDIEGIVDQLSSLGPLASGDWPLLVLIDNALPHVRGTQVAQDLRTIRQALKNFYREARR